MKLVWEYIKYRRFFALLLILLDALFMLLLWLSQADAAMPGYALLLLTLLALGIKDIYLGPTLPAFLSETVVKTLVDAYHLQPITHPQQDLDAILHRG